MWDLHSRRWSSAATWVAVPILNRLATHSSVRIIAEGLGKTGFAKERLALLPSGSGIKVELARKLNRETTMSLKWVAQEPGVGSWN